MSVRDVFINSMYGNDWTEAKSTVICLDIKDELGNKSRIVIRNCPGSEHSEQVLYRIMNDMRNDSETTTYLKSCTFTVYMNWSPCGRSCVECLLEVFAKSDLKSSLFFCITLHQSGWCHCFFTGIRTHFNIFMYSIYWFHGGKAVQSPRNSWIWYRCKD